MSTGPPSHELTPDEVNLLADYRGMKPWAQSMLFDTAKQYRDKWPQRQAPHLRLVLAPTGDYSCIGRQTSES
jgi:hypothetical protein